MSATVHLILGPPGTSRTAPLLAAHRAAGGFGSALWLSPTRRHADRVRAALLAAGSAVVAPQAFAVQAFADELVRAEDAALRPQPDGPRRVLLDGVLAELRDAGELPYFQPVADTRGFADAAAGYVNELKGAGIDLRQLLKATGARKTPEADRHAQATKVFDRYQRKLGRLHRLDPADRVVRAANLWQSGRRGPFAAVSVVILDGFTSLAPAHRWLFDALRETVEDVWVGLPHDADDGRADAFAGPSGVRAWATGAVGEASLFNPRPPVEEIILPADASRPAGLRHLARALFREPSAEPSADASGLHQIEAPGAVGEARLVARRIRTLLAEGVPANRIIVAPRRLEPVVELWREVFDEYAVPHEAEGADPLARVPAVAFLLRAWRLPDDGWAFADVAAVLRSTYFRPAWPEVRSDPEVAVKSETLLRMLGEPRGRDAFLAAVAQWAESPPVPLEDETAEEPRRKRIQRLAVRCRPFLNRFFRAWDKIKPTWPAESFAAWLKQFATDFGVSPAAGLGAADGDGLSRLWAELDRWVKSEAAAGTRRPVSHARFARVLAAATAVPARARSSRAGGRVRLLSAERAVGLPCDHLFLTGLGEGSWPNLSAPDSLLDDPERDRLRKAGLRLPDPAARLGSEQLLFLELASSPRAGLTLSYPAVDAKGQPLLPSSFLRDVQACFAADAVETTRQRMPIEGYLTQEPFSAAERRVQFASEFASRPLRGDGPSGRLPEDLLDNLAAARQAADARFRAHAFGPFDGELRHPAVAAELACRFGPERVLSPTALEAYVACPFRFLLEHVLRLDPLDDPTEEVEHTRRGSAFHRALARFHRWVQDHVPLAADLPAAVGDDLARRITDAVEEYALRAPSVASRELWRLEGRRLLRSAARYRDHWQDFRDPWREKKAAPVPHAFEADFGVPGEPGAPVPDPLVIRVGDVEVRIGGRIDRVDVAELADGGRGFWVIDYKTGRATNYSAAQVERFEKLQLPLYAMAVERVLLADRPARPLGLAYWLVTDTGPKPMLPSSKKQLLSWLADPGRWPKFREQLEAWVATLVGRIRAGDFPLAPRSEHCTDTCRFGPVCRITQSRGTGKLFPLALPVLPKESAPEPDA